jgi:hypothetical protein
MTAPNTLQGSGYVFSKAKTQADTRQGLTCMDQHGRYWAFSVERETMDPCSEFNIVNWPVDDDPLRTPGKYIKMMTGAHGQKDLGRVIVDFHQWVADTKRAMNDWNDQIMTIGQEKFGGSMRVEDLFTDPRVLSWAGAKPWPSVEALTSAAKGDQELLGLAPMTSRGAALLNTRVNLDLNRFHGKNELEESVKDLDLNAPSTGDNAFGRASVASGATISPDYIPDELDSLPIDLDEPLDMGDLTYQDFLKDARSKGQTLADAAAGWKAHKENLNTE